MISRLLYLLYRLLNKSFLRRRIISLLKKMEGGEIHSHTLRKIFKDCHGIIIGQYSYGCFVPNDIPRGTIIGRYCSFAKGVTIFNANHPLKSLSQHPLFYNPILKVVPEETISRTPLVIGHDVWIGRYSLILPRVGRIGNGAIIGAGAVVTKEVPAYAIMAGNPARIIRYRFPQEIQQAVEASEWWSYSIEELNCSLGAFLEPLSSDILLRFLPANKEVHVPKDTND